MALLEINMKVITHYLVTNIHFPCLLYFTGQTDTAVNSDPAERSIA